MRLSKSYVSALLFLFFVGVGFLSFHKTGAVHNSMGFWAYYYWFLDYDYGYIKRGLAGALFQALAQNRTLGVVPVVLWINATFFLAFVSLISFLFVSKIKELKDRSRQSLAVLCGTLFFLSPAVSMLGWTVGFVDVIVFALFALALVLYDKKRFVLGTLAGCVAPLVHDGFFFIWAALYFVLILDYYKHTETRLENRRIVLLATLPLLVAIVSVLFSNHDAALKIIAMLPANEAEKESLASYQYASSMMLPLVRSMDYILQFPRHFLVCLFLIAAPGGVLVWVALRENVSRSKREFLRAVGPLLITLAITGVAFDWSRLISWANLAALVPFLCTDFLNTDPGRSCQQIVTQKAGKGTLLGVLIVCTIFLLSPVVFVQYAPENSAPPENYRLFKKTFPARLYARALTTKSIGF